MQDVIILYKAHIDKFSKRVLRLFYPYLIIYSLFLFLPFINMNADKLILSVWVVLMLSIIIMMLISAHKWAYNQITLLAIHDDLFELEFYSKNRKHRLTIQKENINTTLKWHGGRPKILKLSLLDNNLKVADFYSGGKQKREYALEEIVYKIHQHKTPITRSKQ